VLPFLAERLMATGETDLPSVVRAAFSYAARRARPRRDDVPPCGWRSCLSSYLAAFSSVARDARATFASCTAFGS
jgi:hypothetical protein